MSKEQEYNHLFTSALSLYQILFGNQSDKMEDYKSRVNKNTIEAVLGKKERDELHEKISGKYEFTFDPSGHFIKQQVAPGIRDAFGTLYFSNYYQNYLIDYAENTTEHVLEGQTRCGLHLNTLAINPSSKDCFLNAQNYAATDPWHQHLYNAFFYQTENPPEKEDLTPKDANEELQYVCRALLNQDPQIENSRKISSTEMLDKVGITYSTVIGFACEMIVKQYDAVGSMLSNSNKANLLKDHKQLLRKLSQTLTNKSKYAAATTEKILSYEELLQDAEQKIQLYTNRGTIKKSNAPQKKAMYKKEISRLKKNYRQNIHRYENNITSLNKRIGDVTEGLDKIKKLKIRQLGLGGKVKFLDKLGDNPYFGRALVGLSLFNLVMASKNIADNNINVKDTTNLFAAAIEFPSVMLSQFSALDYQLGRQVATKIFGKQVTARIGSMGIRLSIQAGWAASGIGAVVSALDARDSFLEGDTNAAVAYTVAAAAGLVSVAAGLGTYVGVSTVAGPIGIAAALVALAAVGLALWMTDDDLQVFLKATVFSEDNNLPDSIRTAQQAKEYLYENRYTLARKYKRKLHNEENQTIDMSNFANMTEWLYTMFANFSMGIASYPKLESTVIMEDSISLWGTHEKKPRRMIYTLAMDITCKLGYAKEGDSWFEYFMLIFPFDQADPERFYSIEDVWDRSFNEQQNAGFRFPIIKNSSGFYEIELHFHWKEELQELARTNRLGKQMMFVFGCRVAISKNENEDTTKKKEKYWPLTLNGQRRYAAYYGPLMFDSKTVQDNDFFRHYNKEYIQKRIVGTKEEIIERVLKHYND